MASVTADSTLLVFDNVRKFMTYILTSNIPEIVPYLAFALLGIAVPLTIIQILAINLGTDMLPALALSAERGHPEVMRRPPRARDQPLLEAPLLRTEGRLVGCGRLERLMRRHGIRAMTLRRLRLVITDSNHGRRQSAQPDVPGHPAE